MAQRVYGRFTHFKLTAPSHRQPITFSDFLYTKTAMFAYMYRLKKAETFPNFKKLKR